MRQGRRSGRVAEELPLNANPPRTRSLPLFVARRSPIVVVPPFQLIELFSNKLLHLLHLLWSSGGWIHEGFPLDLSVSGWVGESLFLQCMCLVPFLLLPLWWIPLLWPPIGNQYPRKRLGDNQWPKESCSHCHKDSQDIPRKCWTPDKISSGSLSPSPIPFLLLRWS